jgi:hypothetical protein
MKPAILKWIHSFLSSFTRQLHSADSAGTLPKPCNAGFIGTEWVMENFTESEVQQSRRSVVLEFQKVPLQAFLSVPAESALVICLQR